MKVVRGMRVVERISCRLFCCRLFACCVVFTIPVFYFRFLFRLCRSNRPGGGVAVFERPRPAPRPFKASPALKLGAAVVSCSLVRWLCVPCEQHSNS